MLHVGVDEAGYGPLLGPLVVGVAAFRLTPEEAARAAEHDLRARLRGIVARRTSRGRSRRLPVAVDDSKEIHRRLGLEGLARGVGAFAAAMDAAPPADLEDLIHRFSDRMPGDYATAPWFQGLSGAPVPRYRWTGPLGDRFRAKGVEALDLRVLPLDAPELNDLFARLRNKGRVLGLATGTLLLSILDRYPAEDAEVVLDRHGGRLDYGAYLADLFPFAAISRETADVGEARYEVRLPGRTLRLLFATQADRRFLAVGWASMAAKLTRELFMRRLNAWFAERLPALRPTAGYAADGKRFLRDVEDVLGREGVARERLVRTR